MSGKIEIAGLYFIQQALTYLLESNIRFYMFHDNAPKTKEKKTVKALFVLEHKQAKEVLINNLGGKEK